MQYEERYDVDKLKDTEKESSTDNFSEEEEELSEEDEESVKFSNKLSKDAAILLFKSTTGKDMDLSTNDYDSEKIKDLKNKLNLLFKHGVVEKEDYNRCIRPIFWDIYEEDNKKHKEIKSKVETIIKISKNECILDGKMSLENLSTFYQAT